MNYLRPAVVLIALFGSVSGGSGSLDAQTRREVKAIGCYAGSVSSGDSRGYAVQLWAWNSQIIGLVEYRSDHGKRPPQGMFTEAQYDPGTGKISFEARMTTGLHSCQRHRNVPSHDVLSFHGFLKEDRLEGNLELVNQLDSPPVTLDRLENLALSLDAGCRPMTFEGYEVWHWYLEPEYSARGPKW